MVLQSLMERCRRSGCPLFLAFADIKGAYDKTDQALLLQTLYDDLHLPPRAWRFLDRWYSVGSMRVRMGDGSMSPSFSQARGVKQGDILSPLLYALYVRTIPAALEQAGVHGAGLGGDGCAGVPRHYTRSGASSMLTMCCSSRMTPMTSSGPCTSRLSILATGGTHGASSRTAARQRLYGV